MSLLLCKARQTLPMAIIISLRLITSFLGYSHQVTESNEKPRSRAMPHDASDASIVRPYIVIDFPSQSIPFIPFHRGFVSHYARFLSAKSREYDDSLNTISKISHSLLRTVQLLSKQLVHSKHMHFILLEHSLHSVITNNLSLVARILQVMRSNVLPDLLDHLRSRQLHTKSA